MTRHRQKRWLLDTKRSFISRMIRFEKQIAMSFFFISSRNLIDVIVLDQRLWPAYFAQMKSSHVQDAERLRCFQLNRLANTIDRNRRCDRYSPTNAPDRFTEDHGWLFWCVLSFQVNGTRVTHCTHIDVVNLIKCKLVLNIFAVCVSCTVVSSHER